MIHRYQPWLPQDVVYDGVLEEKLEALLLDWAKAWLTMPAVFKVSIARISAGGNTDEFDRCWQSKDESLCLLHSSKRAEAFAQLLLGYELSERSLNLADRAFLKALNLQAIESFKTYVLDKFPVLTNMLSDLSGVERPNAPQNHNENDVRLSVVIEGVGLDLDFLLNHELVTNLRKAIMLPAGSEADLMPIDSMLETQEIFLGAKVGSAKVKLNEIEDLSSGDILVLDTDLSAHLTVTINDQILPNVKCLMTQDEQDKTLKITNIIVDEQYE